MTTANKHPQLKPTYLRRMRAGAMWTLAALTLSGCAFFKDVGVVVDHWAQAEAAFRKKKYDEAAEHYKAIKTTDSKYQAAQVGIGRCLWRQDKTGEAAEQMLGARRLDADAFDGVDRLVRDLSVVYGAATSRTIAQTSNPAVALFPQADGPLLLVSDRGMLSAFEDGATQWETPLGSPHSGVALDNGVAFALAHDSSSSQVLALDSSTGAPRWTFDLGRTSKEASVAATAGSVYAPTKTGVVALDATSGAPRWTIETPERIGMIVVAGDAACGESAKSFFCWSTATGETLGTYSGPQRSDRGGLASDGSLLYFATDDALYSVEINNGMKLAWKQLVGARLTAPTLDTQSGVVAVATRKHLLTFDAKSGKPRVKAPTPPRGSGSSRLIAPARGDSGWLVSSGNSVYGVDEAGRWTWIAAFEGTLTSAPVPVASAVLVAVSLRSSPPEVRDVPARPW